MIDQIIDFTIIALLIITIFYGIKLSRRISLIQDSKRELASLFKSFDNTILKAQDSITNLKKVSTEIEYNLQSRVDKATLLYDDLCLLSNKAAKIANILEDNSEKQIHNDNVLNYPKTKQEAIEMGKKQKGNSKAADTEKEKAIENLLKNIAKQKQNQKQNNNKDNKKSPINIANTLKALGYGKKVK